MQIRRDMVGKRVCRRLGLSGLRSLWLEWGLIETWLWVRLFGRGDWNGSNRKT